MRTHDLNSDSHSRHAPPRVYATCSSQAGQSLWKVLSPWTKKPEKYNDIVANASFFSVTNNNYIVISM
jgi:hypothetical protein